MENRNDFHHPVETASRLLGIAQKFTYLLRIGLLDVKLRHVGGI